MGLLTSSGFNLERSVERGMLVQEIGFTVL